jgi:tetratricopeptide (TPR) repeat protein
MLAESPQDPFVLYNLGIVKEQRGDLHEALKDLLAAKKLAPAAAAYRPGLIRDISKLLLAFDRPDEAVQLLNEECEYYPDYPDLQYLLGRSYRMQGLFPEAVQRFQKAIGCQSPSALYPIETGTATFRAYTELGEVLGKLGQRESAKLCFEQALESHVGYMPAVLGWAAALDSLNVPADIIAERLLQLLAKLPDGSGKFAEVMYYLGHYDKLTAPRNEEPFHSNKEFQYFAALAHLHLKQSNQSVSILQNLSHTDLPGCRDDILQMLAIATWSGGSALAYEFYWELDAESRRLYRSLERRLWQLPKEAQDASILQLTMEVISKSIQTGVLDTAAQFAQSDPSLLLHSAKCLYRNGYVRLAADLFLHLLEEGRLDGEATASLAEILYDRGHYGEASALFEQAVPERGDAARIGAALSYLQTARSVLQAAMERNPDSPLLRGDAQKTDASIDLLGKIDWRTEWTPAQRRNADVVTPDFLMHDC